MGTLTKDNIVSLSQALQEVEAIIATIILTEDAADPVLYQINENATAAQLMISEVLEASAECEGGSCGRC